MFILVCSLDLLLLLLSYKWGFCVRGYFRCTATDPTSFTKMSVCVFPEGGHWIMMKQEDALVKCFTRSWYIWSCVSFLCWFFNLFFLVITSKLLSIDHKLSRMVSQIALTWKPKLAWVMPPHFRAVTVTACLAVSLLHLRHMMQEDVRLFCLPPPPPPSLEHCGGVCMFLRMVCVCVWVAVCVEWASIFFFHGQSCNAGRNFMRMWAFASDSKINMVHCGCRRRSQMLCVCACVSQIVEQRSSSGSQLYRSAFDTQTETDKPDSDQVFLALSVSSQNKQLLHFPQFHKR